MTNLQKRLSIWALIVIAILLIPVIGHWPWTLFDFIWASVVLFGTALCYELLARRSKTTIHRVATAIMFLGMLMIIWINGAVGIIGENNIFNLLYLLVVAIGIVGAFVSRLKPKNIVRTLNLISVLIMLIPIGALFFARETILFQPPGVVKVFIINIFFVVIFSISAHLFRRTGISDNINPIETK